MNLNNISDEELDRLFKASAENFDPPFDPEAWAAVDQKLEEGQVRHSWFMRFYLYIGLFALVSVIGISTIIELKQNSKVNKQTTSISVEQIEQPVNKKQSGIIKSEDLIFPKNPAKSKSLIIEVKKGDVKERSQLAKTGKQNPTSTVQDQAVDNHRVRNKRKIYNPLSKVELQEVGALKTKPHSRIVENKEIADAFTKRNSGTEEASILDSLRRDRSSESITGLEVVSTEDSTQAKSKLSENNVVTLPEDSTSHEEQSPPERKSWFLSSLQIAVAVAPDVTTIKFKDPEGVSANAGILFGVPLTRKLSLISGVVWATKVYSANPEEYDFTNGNGYTSYINVTCKVLDIPINLRYQVLEVGKNVFAVQAGISSYLMLNEKYSSEYGGYYGYNYEVDNKNRHWFKVQNVSLVYTRILSPVFSVGIEPFVKIPYSGIGAGKVKLTSAGMFFTAGYTLKLKP